MNITQFRRATLASLFLLHGIAGTAPAQQSLEREPLLALARNCGHEIDWIATWPEARERAKQEGRRILVLVRTLSGLDLPDAAMLGPFMDPDIVELVRERYVALRYAKGMQAPFASQDSYGMGPMTFGTSILVVDERGDVVGDTFSLESSTLYDFLCRHAGDDGASPDVAASPLVRARWHLARGELEKAEALVVQETGAPAELLRAELLRRRRLGDEALEALARAEEAGVAAVDLAVPRAILLARCHQVDAALEELERVPADHPDHAQALFYGGSLSATRQHRDQARIAYTQLVTDHPDSRWSWLAAATLVLGALERPGEPLDPGWPAADVVAALDMPAWEPLPASQVDRARVEAVAWLLAHQRDDGSWVVPMQVMDPGDSLRNPLVVGVTSLAARSLLPHVDRPAVAAAVERACHFLRVARARLEERGARFAVMDYSVWSMPSQILFLTAAADRGVIDAEDWRPHLEALVTDLVARQKAGGGWNYYLGASLDSLDPNVNISFSFVTAYVLHGLLAAQEAGLEVPEEVVDRGLGCLVRCRNDDGTFEYSLAHSAEDAPRTPTPAGSAGRGPLCTLVLTLWGEAEPDWVERALEQFVEHRASYAREHGKTLMHCGPEGQGSHYLMFDYAYAAAATLELSGATRARLQAVVLDQVLAARRVGGGFVDNPMIGDPYGTAMALWVMDRLAPGRKGR